MRKVPSQRTLLSLIIFGLIGWMVGCAVSASNTTFFGKTNPPPDNVLRYVSGSEPESLDPQIPTGQPEARICMALYEGLTEYDPKTTTPIPALAERWEVNKDSSEFTFHLRHDGRFSNGDPITARDFVYTIRRGLTPGLGSRTAAMAYPIKYAQAFNSGGVFVFDPNSKTYLLEKDFAEAAEKTYEPADPTRVVLPSDQKKRQTELDANPKLKAAAAGKQFVPVEAEDVGVDAVNDYTLHISLGKPAPFFVSMMPHVFLRVPHPMYWDAKRVNLDGIVFYLLQHNTPILNLYKAGELDAMYNHTVPAAWLDVIGPAKDFMDAPEASVDYYFFNTTKGPTSDVRVRKALNMALDKKALADWRHVKPLSAITPDGIFPGYPQPKGDPFDPEKAKLLLAEAGYRDAAGNFDP